MTMKNAAVLDVSPCCFLVTDVSEESIASIIRVTIGELITTISSQRISVASYC
jgi:uncharacterized membrane protein